MSHILTLVVIRSIDIIKHHINIFIVSSSLRDTTELSILLTSCFNKIKTHVVKYKNVLC